MTELLASDNSEIHPDYNSPVARHTDRIIRIIEQISPGFVSKLSHLGLYDLRNRIDDIIIYAHEDAARLLLRFLDGSNGSGCPDLPPTLDMKNASQLHQV